MNRISAIKSWLLKIQSKYAVSDAVLTDAPPHALSVARQLCLRYDNGMRTSLRELHKVSNLTQTQALQGIAWLESQDLVLVERNSNDAFESVVSPTTALCEELSAHSRQNAA